MKRQLRGNLPPSEKANGKNRFLSLLLLFMAFISVQVYAQDVKISGTVIAEADKFPIIGANIVVKGTTIGTVTDIDGNFSLDVPQNSTIAVSYIGCETQEIKITGAKTLNIVLKDNAIGLDDVVVIGYGSQRKSDLTGGIVAVGEEKLQMVTTNNLMDKLAGQVPGLNITNSKANPSEDQTLRVRGENSLSADNSPLIVLDGIPYSGSLGDIDPDIIENLSVLKDASSAAIYGS
ncbi:carboxypeptidase-like regulatory domain-containing protein, partial [uncultured Parabacteroides sp.]